MFLSYDLVGSRAVTAGVKRQISSTVQTAKMNDINPETCFRDTLTRVANGYPINRIGELLPWCR